MRKNIAVLLAFMMLPFIGTAYAFWGCEKPKWGYIRVKDGYPFKKGSILTTPLKPNCEDSDGNTIRTTNCQHLQPNTRGWAAHLSSMAKMRYGGDGNRAPNIQGYITNGTGMWITQGGDPIRDMKLYRIVTNECNPDFGGDINLPQCKWQKTFWSQFWGSANPGGIYGGAGPDASADSLHAIYDPVHDRYTELGKYGAMGWKIKISQATSVITTYGRSAAPNPPATGTEVNVPPIKHKIQAGDQIRIADYVSNGTSGDASLIWPKGVLPANISALRDYYAVNVTDTTFQISETKGGAPINMSSSPSSGNIWAIDTNVRGGMFGGMMDNASQWDGVWTKSIGSDGNNPYTWGEIEYLDPHYSDWWGHMVLGYNAAGINQMMLTVSIADLEEKKIEHAVGVVLPDVYLGAPPSIPHGLPWAHSYPATKNDGGGGTNTADCDMPEGSWLRLDPDVWTDDVIEHYIGGPISAEHPYGDGRGWGTPTTWVQTVMKGARDYGWIVSDKGSNINIRMQVQGYRDVIKYDGTRADYTEGGYMWFNIVDTQNNEDMYFQSGTTTNQYPEYLPGDAYWRRDGRGIFRGSARGEPGAGGPNDLGTFPTWALQMLPFDMNGWPAPTCACRNYEGADIKTGGGYNGYQEILTPCWTR
jgi:hypothetical protein